MSKIDQKVIDRIKKLLKLAEGTNYEDEAASALAMAQEKVIIKYKNFT